MCGAAAPMTVRTVSMTIERILSSSLRPVNLRESQLQTSQMLVQAEVRGRTPWRVAQQHPPGGRGASPTRLPTLAHPPQLLQQPARGRSPTRRSPWKQHSPPHQYTGRSTWHSVWLI